MKFKLLEKYGYHFGDLNIAKKSENRQSDFRGTGHFGTGFYFVSSSKPEFIPRTYAERNCWQIDLDKYNLYTPSNNSDGYRLHDDLKFLNNLPLVDLNSNSRESLTDELFDLEDEYDNEGLLKFLKKYFPYTLDDYTLKDYVEEGLWGKVEYYAKKLIREATSNYEQYQEVISRLSNRFNKSEQTIKQLINKAIQSNSTDSISTLFMKSLGYDGVDVSHLNKDQDGTRGLDDFQYGSVVYDLKPGTYKQI